MKNRKPLEIKPLILLYDLGMVLMNAWILQKVIIVPIIISFKIWGPDSTISEEYMSSEVLCHFLTFFLKFFHIKIFPNHTRGLDKFYLKFWKTFTNSTQNMPKLNSLLTYILPSDLAGGTKRCLGDEVDGADEFQDFVCVSWKIDAFVKPGLHRNANVNAACENDAYIYTLFGIRRGSE